MRRCPLWLALVALAAPAALAAEPPALDATTRDYDQVHLDLVLDFPSVAAAGSMLGSAALMVVAEPTCMVEVSLRLARFFRHESCGKCIPCREGTYQIVRLLEGVQKGEGTRADLDEVVDLCGVIRQAAFCGLGQACVNPVMSCIKTFRQEFEEHLDGGRCSQGEGP